MGSQTGRTAGKGPRVGRLVRRPAAAFLFALFVVANPAYFCTLNCLLHDHGARADHHAHVAAMGDMCHPGPQVTDQGAPGRELSPALPRAVREPPAAPVETSFEDPGMVGSTGSFLPAPLPPPPRA